VSTISPKTSEGSRRIYFTSDWHVGHKNVIEFDCRPFKDLDHMHRVLVNNYNATVGEEDLCYFLGDVGLCKSEVLAKVLQELNGTKVLVLGNHDKGATAMHRLGFDVVLNVAAIEVAGELVTMTHCPLRGVWREDVEGMKGSAEGEHWHGETRHLNFSIEAFGQFHLHGHTHKGPDERILDRQMDVGVRANNYRPVSISEIESWITKQKKQASQASHLGRKLPRDRR
jgi:calcineurin-like phosphoesterase family protein